MTTAIVHHPVFLKHDTGPHHPESPSRYAVVMDALRSDQELWPKLLEVQAREAPRGDVQACHASQMYKTIEHAVKEGIGYLDADTTVSMHSLDAALHGAGAACQAIDLVMRGEAKNAFVPVRPPGHHATPERAMGFCLFNNVAIGAMHAIEGHGLERVAVLDFDVHHGNGTEAAFHEDPRVMLCSTFQHPYYPYCGADSGNDHIINVPLPAMTDGRGFRDAVERFWMPALEAFKPELVFVSAGFDAHR